MDEKKITLLCETMFDLTWDLVYALEHKNPDHMEYDSRVLFQSVYAWAKEFEATHIYNEEDCYDCGYLDDVDEFFWKKVEEEYPELV